MTEELIAYARACWGRWLADCPRGCGNAEHFGADPTTKYVGGLTSERFTCGICGLSCRAEWPQDRPTIEALLATRPAPCNRNWNPGESLHDLLAENVEHGLIGV